MGRVQGHSQLHDESEAKLGYKRTRGRKEGGERLIHRPPACPLQAQTPSLEKQHLPGTKGICLASFPPSFLKWEPSVLS